MRWANCLKSNFIDFHNIYCMGGEISPFLRAQSTSELQEASEDPWSRPGSTVRQKDQKNPQVKGPKPAVLCCIRDPILLQDIRNFCTLFAPSGPAWSHLFSECLCRKQTAGRRCSRLPPDLPPPFFSKQPMGRNPVLLEDDLQQWEQCQHYLCF